MNPLIIRADATSEIGTGHVMRGLALAQAWQDKGGKVVLISRCESDALRQRISAEGIDLISLDKPHPDPFDLDLTINTLNKLQAQNSTLKSWLVVDGYHFDADYQKSIKAAGYKLLWIDDCGHAHHYYADLVLNQNISADPSFYIQREPYTQLLLGTRYALLRREFTGWQGWQREISPVARKILVTLGGGDPDNVTLKVIQALKQVEVPGLEARIVVGPASHNLETLRRAMQEADGTFQLLTNVAAMPELMAWSDLAVSAGGSTCWELKFMGVPGIVLVLAENQTGIAQGLEQAGTAINLGWFDRVCDKEITLALSGLIMDRERRQHMSRASQQLVDGNGVGRVIDRLQASFSGAG